MTLTGAIVRFVILAAVLAGGYFGWRVWHRKRLRQLKFPVTNKPDRLAGYIAEYLRGQGWEAYRPALGPGIVHARRKGAKLHIECCITGSDLTTNAVRDLSHKERRMRTGARFCLMTPLPIPGPVQEEADRVGVSLLHPRDLLRLDEMVAEFKKLKMEERKAAKRAAMAAARREREETAAMARAMPAQKAPEPTAREKMAAEFFGMNDEEE